MIKKLLPHFFALLFFLVLASIYFSPIFSGKTLSMHDVNMANGAAKEAKDFHDASGGYTWWTNSMFGGMPTYMIYGNYEYSLGSQIGSFLFHLMAPVIYTLFILMACFYFMLIAMKKNIYVSVIGAVAFAFGTYNLLYIEAGHLSKILALAYGAGLIGGISLIYRQKYLPGTIITILFLSLEIGANHLQITYYYFWIILFLTVYQFADLIKNGKSNQLGKIVLYLFISVLIGVGSQTSRLWSANVYSKESTRGKSDLTDAKVGKSGLDMDYAFAWSYGKSESLNLIIPNLMGGSSTGGGLDKDSETYKTLTSGGVDANQARNFIKNLPTYYGDQSFTTGPAYVGIIVAFLFILGLFFNKNQIQWVLFGLALIAIVLSWGSNFLLFNEVIFLYLPGYNKFRAVTMLLIMVHFLLCWGASNTIEKLFYTEIPQLRKFFGYTSVIFLVFFGIAFFSVNFSGPADANLQKSLSQSLGPEFTQRIISSLREDRSNMATSDVFRSIIFIVLLGVSIYLFYTKKIKLTVFALIILGLILIDEIGVDKRYFNNDDFISKSKSKVELIPTAADETILKDKDLDFRVLNTTGSFLSEANTSNLHKSVGGYHGAKLKKYQEFVEYVLTKDGQFNMNGLNLLNTKYIISNSPNGQPVAQINPGANGNAWFVEKLISAKNADEEIKVLGEIDNKKEAVKIGGESKNFEVDSTSKIKLVSYEPNKLIYESNANKDGYVVFSEIYYRGNIDWISRIDGKVVPHDKVDYTFRGMAIPAGKHTIEFKFDPESIAVGRYFDLVSLLAFIGLIGIVIASNSLKKKD